MPKTATPLADRVTELEAEIIVAETATWECNDVYRRLGPTVRIDHRFGAAGFDPTRRLAKLRAGVRVDAAIAKVAELKGERAGLILASLEDPAFVAEIEAECRKAKAQLDRAEQAAREARLAYAQAQSAHEGRTTRVNQLSHEIADSERAAMNARSAAAKAETEIAELEQLARLRVSLNASDGGS